MKGGKNSLSVRIYWIRNRKNYRRFGQGNKEDRHKRYLASNKLTLAILRICLTKPGILSKIPV